MTERGDIIELDDHVVMCGDATNPDDVRELMGGQKAELLFTSPPYADLRTYGGIANLDEKHLAEFIPAWKKYAEYIAVNVGLIRRGYEIVEWWRPYFDSAKKAGLKRLAWNVWDKLSVGGIGSQSAMFPIRHEWIFVFGEKYKTLNKTWPKRQPENADRDREITRRNPDGTMTRQLRRYLPDRMKQMESVSRIMTELRPIRSKHPACFPPELPQEYIKAMTESNDIVADCFGGSGSTLIAAAESNRKSRIMEINPEYCDVIKWRYEQWKNN